eukprot:2690134-Pleurochrysis_carterae.AAC.1
MATHAKSNQGITPGAELGVTLSSVSTLTPPSAATAIDPFVGDACRYHNRGRSGLETGTVRRAAGALPS